MLMHKGRLNIDVEYLKFIKLVLESNNYVNRGITPEIAGLSARLFSEDTRLNTLRVPGSGQGGPR